MKRIAVVAVRIAVELEEGQDLAHAEVLVHDYLETMIHNREMEWCFDTWGSDTAQSERHLFEVDDDWGWYDIPQIQGRDVRLV